MISRLSPTDYRLLKVFKEVVRMKGFSAAEEVLGLNQPTISSHMKHLEERFGFVLCRRNRGEFALTAAGREVYDALLELETGVDGFVAKVAGIQGALSGRLRVAVPSTLAHTLHLGGIPDAIASLARSDHELQVEVFQGHLEEIELGLLDGRYDIAISGMNLASSRITAIELFSLSMSLYCGKSHPMFAREDSTISLADVFAMPHVLFWGLPENGQDQSQNALRTGSSEVSLYHILAGTHVGYLSDVVAAPFRERGELRALADRLFHRDLPGGILVQTKLLDDERVRLFVDAMTASMGAAQDRRPALKSQDGWVRHAN